MHETPADPFFLFCIYSLSNEKQNCSQFKDTMKAFHNIWDASYFVFVYLFFAAVFNEGHMEHLAFIKKSTHSECPTFIYIVHKIR